MPPDDHPQSDQPGKPARPLPAELAFLLQLSHRPPMEPDEVGPWARGLLKKIQENADLMRQHELDPDLMTSRLEPLIENLERAQSALDEAQDKLLHSAADV